MYEYLPLIGTSLAAVVAGGFAWSYKNERDDERADKEQAEAAYNFQKERLGKLRDNEIKLTDENGDLKTRLQKTEKKLTTAEGKLSAAQLELDTLKKPAANKAPAKKPAAKRPARKVAAKTPAKKTS